MPRPNELLKKSFAYVYDALYGGNSAFLQTQLAFITAVFGPPPARLLDLGCGTGSHLILLAAKGYFMVGVDIDPLMLDRTRRKAPEARLALADLRRLPFGRGFHGALCLESPLAYLLDDRDLKRALRSVRDLLYDQGKLLVDVYDYRGTLSDELAQTQEARFETDEMRVTVRESHRYEKKTRLWTMTQRFEVDEADARSEFKIVHHLRMRSMDEYAEALEDAGFTVLEALTAYPNAPEALRHERRLILVACRKVRRSQHS